MAMKEQCSSCAQDKAKSKMSKATMNECWTKQNETKKKTSIHTYTSRRSAQID